MSDDTNDTKDDVDEVRDPELLPPREVLSLLDPAAGGSTGGGLDGLTGFGGGLLGGDPTGATPTDAAPTGDAGSLGDAATGMAQHAGDGQQADSPSISDQPQTLPPDSTETSSSAT